MRLRPEAAAWMILEAAEAAGVEAAGGAMSLLRRLKVTAWR